MFPNKGSHYNDTEEHLTIEKIETKPLVLQRGLEFSWCLLRCLFFFSLKR